VAEPPRYSLWLPALEARSGASRLGLWQRLLRLLRRSAS